MYGTCRIRRWLAKVACISANSINQATAMVSAKAVRAAPLLRSSGGAPTGSGRRSTRAANRPRFHVQASRGRHRANARSARFQTLGRELRMKGLLRDELLLPRIGASLPTLLTARILVSPMTARSSVIGCLVRTFVHRPCFLVALATCAVATVGVAHTSAWTSGQQDSPAATHRPLPPNRANPATSPYPQNIPTTPEDVSRLRLAA